jgi:hypothetical protein
VIPEISSLRSMRFEDQDLQPCQQVLCLAFADSVAHSVTMSAPRPEQTLGCQPAKTGRFSSGFAVAERPRHRR